MKTLKLFALATVLATTAACTKKGQEKKAPPEPAVTTGSGSAPGSAPGSADPGSAPGSADPGATATTPDANADFIAVYAEHAKKKPDDPVEVRFDKFKVVKADFDPQKIEGGSATLEVDLTSLRSGSEKRDGHLTTADYIDTAKFATMTIDVGNVKKKDGNAYTADAKVKLRDIEKTYPVTFEVVEAKDDWVRVRGEHKFPRLDFKVGKPASPDESVAQDLTVRLQLTLKKT